MIKRFAYLVGLIGIAIGVATSVRIGAIAIAAALALFVAPDFRGMRTIEKIISVALFVSLITMALALPRR